MQSADIAQWAGAVTLALGGLAIGLQRLIKNWRETGASSDVVKLLHEEVKRMGTHNAKLMEEIAHLQTQIMQLNTQLGELHIENQRLNQQVTSLREEILRLKTL